MNRTERLTAYAKSFVGVDVAWGENDCCMFVARWIEQETGEPLDLPTYDTYESAHALIDSAGTLADLWTRLAADAGLMETGEPVLGDVAVIETARFGQVGVIFVDNGVTYWRESKGVTLFQPRAGTVVKAWRVPEAVA